MAYIQIELAGQKTFGGYLKIDGEKQIKLIDGLLIPVSAGIEKYEQGKCRTRKL